MSVDSTKALILFVYVTVPVPVGKLTWYVSVAFEEAAKVISLHLKV